MQSVIHTVPQIKSCQKKRKKGQVMFTTSQETKIFFFGGGNCIRLLLVMVMPATQHKLMCACNFTSPRMCRAFTQWVNTVKLSVSVRFISSDRLGIIINNTGHTYTHTHTHTCTHSMCINIHTCTYIYAHIHTQTDSCTESEYHPHPPKKPNHSKSTEKC